MLMRMTMMMMMVMTMKVRMIMVMMKRLDERRNRHWGDDQTGFYRKIKGA
jgi:hypothetical protein